MSLPSSALLSTLAPGRTYSRLCPSGRIYRIVLEVVRLGDAPFRVRYRTEVLGRRLVRTCSVKSLRRWAERVEPDRSGRDALATYAALALLTPRLLGV